MMGSWIDRINDALGTNGSHDTIQAAIDYMNGLLQTAIDAVESEDYPILLAVIYITVEQIKPHLTVEGLMLYQMLVRRTTGVTRIEEVP